MRRQLKVKEGKLFPPPYGNLIEHSLKSWSEKIWWWILFLKYWGIKANTIYCKGKLMGILFSIWWKILPLGRLEMGYVYSRRQFKHFSLELLANQSNKPFFNTCPAVIVLFFSIEWIWWLGWVAGWIRRIAWQYCYSSLWVGKNTFPAIWLG